MQGWINFAFLLILFILVVLVVALMVSYSSQRTSLNSALSKLDDAVEETVVLMEEMLPRLRNSMVRLIENVKTWFLDWLTSFSSGSSTLLDYYRKTLQKFIEQIWFSLMQINTIFLEMERQKKLMIEYNLKPNLRWKRVVFEYKAKAFVTVQTANGLLWVLQKFFCTLVGIGAPLASFLTEEVAQALGWFYSNILGPYLVGPLRDFFSFFSPDFILDGLKDLWDNELDDLKSDILALFTPEWISDALDFLEDLWDSFVDWLGL
jgi:hypothetical protein